MEPTIVTEASSDMELAHEESFGPVLCGLRYTDQADAIRQANDSRGDLGAGVWSVDYERAVDISVHFEWRRLNQTWCQMDPAVPFGGYKLGGLG